MEKRRLWKLGRASGDVRDKPDLYARLIEEVRQELKLHGSALLCTLVNTAVPVRAATITLFSFHMIASPDDVPCVIRAAASEEGHRYQRQHAAAESFSDLFVSSEVSWIPDGYFISMFIHPARSPEDVVSDITEVQDGGAYFVEDGDGTVFCSVVRTSDVHYYHIYPHEAGLIVAGPASFEQVCNSLVTVYPRSLAGSQRFVVQKNVFRPYVRDPE